MKKKIFLLLVSAVLMMTAAAVPVRKMLEQGKSWVYIYHHFEDRDTPDYEGWYYDHDMWLVYYTLKGDTVIDGQKYMKMFRLDERSGKQTYFGSLREDDEGRVYLYNYYGDKKDFPLIDFTMQSYEEAPTVTRTEETVKENGQLFRRFCYQGISPDGNTYDTGFVAVEGVGFRGKGLVHYLYEPEPDCICDYEELSFVYSSSFWFTIAGFSAPKEIEMTDGERQLVESNNDFAFRLFREVRGDRSSIVSPLSITFALGMMNNGAAGQTQQEINQTLGFGKAGADAINAFCRRLLSEADKLDEKTQALIANTIFVNEGQGYHLQDGFVNKANEYYDAEPQSRDFNDGETMDVINQWASDHTMGLIPSILNEFTFNPDAVSYLLNALYFKGSWSHPFDAKETKEESFGGGPAVPMMHKPYTDFAYTENDIYQAVKLPYGNGAYTMSVYLPREGKTISEVLETFSGKSWQVGGHTCEVDLKMPRFETESTLGLAGTMSALGMPTAFSPAAEFPYFCNTSVFIGGMLQKAKIKLDEQGTEAAAVTLIDVTSGMPEMTEFHATRPFLYIISEQSTGAIFFIGQYTGGITTGDVIDGITTLPAQQPTVREEKVYTLSGQRLDKTPARGLYIKNGKLTIK